VEQAVPTAFQVPAVVHVPVPIEVNVQAAARAGVTENTVTASITIKIAENNFEKIDLFIVWFLACMEWKSKKFYKINQAIKIPSQLSKRLRLYAGCSTVNCYR
jgi:hypothetical protein